MESTIQSFKSDLIAAIWNHGRKMLVPTIVIGVIMFLISLVTMYFAFTKLLGFDMQLITELMSGSSNPFEMQEKLRYQMEDIVRDPYRLIGIGSLIAGVMMVIQSFVYTIMLKLSGNQVTGEGSLLGDAFSKVTLKHMLLILLYFIVMFLIYAVMVFVMALVAGLTHPLIMLLFLPFMLLILFRFSNVVPALVLGDMSFGEAMTFSWNTITWKRSFLIIVGGVVVLIIITIASLIFNVLVGFLGTVGFVLSLIFRLVMNVFTLAMSTAFFTAIYYRYAEVEGDDTMIESIGTE